MLNHYGMTLKLKIRMLKMFYFSDQFNQKGSISSSNVENTSFHGDAGLVHPAQHSPHAFLSKPVDRNYLIITIVVNKLGGKVKL